MWVCGYSLLTWTTLTIYCATSKIGVWGLSSWPHQTPWEKVFQSLPQSKSRHRHSENLGRRVLGWTQLSIAFIFWICISVVFTHAPSVLDVPESRHLSCDTLQTINSPFSPWTKRGKCPAVKTGFKDLHIYCFLNSFQLFFLILAIHSLHPQFQSNWICFSQPFEGSAITRLVVGFFYWQFNGQLSQVC